MPVIVEEASTGSLPQLLTSKNSLDRIRVSRTFQVSITGPELHAMKKAGMDPDTFLFAAIMDALYPIGPSPDAILAQEAQREEMATRAHDGG